MSSSNFYAKLIVIVAIAFVRVRPPPENVTTITTTILLYNRPFKEKIRRWKIVLQFLRKISPPPPQLPSFLLFFFFFFPFDQRLSSTHATKRNYSRTPTSALWGPRMGRKLNPSVKRMDNEDVPCFRYWILLWHSKHFKNIIHKRNMMETESHR